MDELECLKLLIKEIHTMNTSLFVIAVINFFFLVNRVMDKDSE